MFNGPFKSGFITQPQADALNRLAAKVAALDGITTVPPLTIQRGPGGRPIIAGGVTGSDGTDTTFLVLLTERDFTGTFVKYAAVEVEASGSVTYAVRSGGRTFGFGEGETPLYQQRNMLHPVVGVDGGGAPNYVKKGSVVRVWTGPDGIHFFKALPPVVPLRRTGNEGTVGEDAYIRENRNDNPGAPTWVDGDAVEVVPVE
jgi:hypothetical protein